MRTGIRLSLDIGNARIGVARSDNQGSFVFPVKTILRDKKNNSDIKQLYDIVKNFNPIEIIIGLPILLSGENGLSVNLVKQYIKLISKEIPNIPICLLDERFSTKRARKILLNNGIKSIKHKKIIDQVAAMDILEQALDIEKNTGKLIGYMDKHELEH